jgi:hypothetical protein
VFWGNIGDEGTVESAQISLGGHDSETLAIDYSCIQGWTGDFGGVGNTGADPLLVDADGADDTPGTEDDNLRLSAGSPCIDAGDNSSLWPEVLSDLGGGFRRSDDPGAPDTGSGISPVVDIGAYERQRDCDDDGIGDGQEILSGSSPDCNNNTVPDECDLADGTSVDVNSTGVPDECEDCNENGILDPQDIADGTSDDCNLTGSPDECDIVDGTSRDCNDNSLPDECEGGENCNGNGILDECEIAVEASLDCNNNSMLDVCEGGDDCNGNGVLDECDLADGTSTDCSGDGVLDECEDDCNGSGIPDACDIIAGISEDLNENGVPDECEVLMNRYIPLLRDVAAGAVAYQVTLTQSLEFPGSAGLSWWVAAPDADGVSRLAGSPVIRDWSGDPRLIYVGDCQIVPATTYEIRTTPDGVGFSDPVEVPTAHRPGTRYYGDVVGIGTGDYPPRPGFTPPNGAANVSDIQAFLLTAQGVGTPSVPTTWVDLHGLGEGIPPNLILNVADLQRILFGIDGQRYADAPDQLAPADCP